jgi:predicted AlkP superfamily phosphohydrolase/phosphomutase
MARLATAGSGVALALILVGAPGCSREPASYSKSVIVLGIDGMDYTFTREMLDAGELPNLARLAAQGGFQALETSVPPLSPVAWSDFTTGMDAGGHGIYDFMHRDLETGFPYLSTSRTVEGEGRTLGLGAWQVPLSGGGHERLQRGKPFWEVLAERGVPTTVIRMPANFPVSGTADREISGMGTPDVTGSYGIFSFYTSELFFEKREIAGGEIRELDYWDGIARGVLYGPPNPFRKDGKTTTVPFTLYADEESGAGKLEVGDEERLLQVGEWSDWVPFQFTLLPGPMDSTLMGIDVMARFYLRQVKPEIELYVSPINFDPFGGDLPMSEPEDFAAELAEHTGRFYTQGMPEDTQALKGKILTDREFLAQAKIAGEEIEAQLPWMLEQHRGGLLFFYAGSIDQVSHMVWKGLDPGHPAYDPEDAFLGEALRDLYRAADRMVGYTMEHLPKDAALVVMSDHGFASWRRTFHLNAWLAENGYLAIKNPNLKDDPGLFLNVDWSKTRAYGLGLNGLYVNQRGREKNGIVEPGSSAALLAEITEKLLAEIDPATGLPAVTRIYKTDEYFEQHGHIHDGPDMVVGYAKGTRGASASVLGEVIGEVLTDNVDDWNGDHGMDHTTVPGVLFTNRPLAKPAAALKDLAAAIVAEFGVEEFPVRNGESP